MSEMINIKSEIKKISAICTSTKEDEYELIVSYRGNLSKCEKIVDIFFKSLKRNKTKILNS